MEVKAKVSAASESVLGKITRWADRVKEPVYTVMVGTLYAIYLLTYLKVFEVDREIVATLRAAVTVLVCAFLILKFNPLRTSMQLKHFDSTIIFGSAIIILTNLVSVPDATPVVRAACSDIKLA
jgi:hypothetical protein